MYLLDEFKKDPDYLKILYTEATSAGSVCTMARALLLNLRAYMSDSEIHPSVLLTMQSLDSMFAMRDDWLNRLRDLDLAKRAPLPFDEKVGASVPIETQARARATTRAISDATKATIDTQDVDLIFTQALAAISAADADAEPTPAPTPKPKRRQAHRKAAD